MPGPPAPPDPRPTFNFNNAANWVGGTAPTGTATIAVPGLFDKGQIVFAQTTTSLANLNMNEAAMFLAAGQTLNLSGTATLTCCFNQRGGLTALGLAGTLNGNVVLNGSPIANSLPQLVGGGVINGTLTALGAIVAPGVINISSALLPGVMTVNGNVTLGNGTSPQTILSILTTADGTSASQLVSTGTASLGSSSVVGINVPSAGSAPFPKSATFTVLTATGGLTGGFGSAFANGPYAFLTPSVAYTSNSALVTVTRDFSSDAVPAQFQAFGDSLN